MPVEIRELIIRAVVSEEHDMIEKSLPPDTNAEDKEAIIAACVKQVLRILQHSRER
jgi:hypothetical protein